MMIAFLKLVNYVIYRFKNEVRHSKKKSHNYFINYITVV